MRIIIFPEKIYRLQHYSQVVAAYITMKTTFNLTILITGLSRAHRDGVAYHDVKKPRYIIAKNGISVFMVNVWHYVTVTRTVCVLDIEKRNLYIKRAIFHFPFSLSIGNSRNRTQNFKRSNENISNKNNRKVKH